MVVQRDWNKADGSLKLWGEKRNVLQIECLLHVRVWELKSEKNKNIDFVHQKVSKFPNAGEERECSPNAN